MNKSIALSEVIDRRDFDRVDALLKGKWYAETGEGFDCSTLDMSMCGIRLSSRHKPEIESIVTLLLEGLTPMTGKVSRLLDDGFAICLADRPVEETVDLAIFSRSYSPLPTANDRMYPRTITVHKLARLKRPGHTETLARVIDVSRSGIAVEARGLSKGDCLQVGSFRGTVVRTWYCGAAIEFDDLIPQKSFTLRLSFQ